jgi:hypothetical protein
MGSFIYIYYIYIFDIQYYMDSPSFLGDLVIPYASLCSMFLFGATKWILLYVSHIYEFHAVGSWLTTKFYFFKKISNLWEIYRSSWSAGHRRGCIPVFHPLRLLYSLLVRAEPLNVWDASLQDHPSSLAWMI